MTPRPVCFPDPVQDRANLYDRSAALADVLDSLTHRTTVIRGGRLMGKTSLLNVVALSIETRGNFAIIRLAPTDSRVEFMAEILDGIHQWVEEHRPVPPHVQAANRGLLIARGRRSHVTPQQAEMAVEHAGNTVAKFCKRIATLSDLATGIVFLLCVDEFDSLIQNWDEHEARLLLELIAHLDTMPRLPVRFLLTLSIIPDLVLSSFRSPILNQAKIVILDPWDEDETARFIEWLVGDQLRFEHDAHAALFAAAGGHPYFTKAVLNALLMTPRQTGARPVSAAQVATAVDQVVRSPEVDLALNNLVGAHLSADAVALLDRIGNSPAGVTNRGLGDLPSTGQILNILRTEGLLRQQGDRYLLRLGMWRQWRTTTAGDRPRPPRLRNVGRAIKRIRGRSLTSWVVIAAVTGPLLAVILTTAFLAPDRTIVIRPCGSASNLAISATYPAFASAGDRQQIHVIISTYGPTEVNGSAQISFPPGQARPDGSNWKTFMLRAGDQATFDVAFITTARASWLTGPVTQVDVQLAISAAGPCDQRHWSIAVAPIPHLERVRSVAGTILAVFLVPLGVEFVIRRLLRDGRSPRASEPKDS